MTLFDPLKSRPLAERLRPKALHEVVGQEHLTSGSGPLAGLVARPMPPSLILWGPPGCGKTTIARLIAAESGAHFEALSATQAGVAELRVLYAAAEKRHEAGGKTVVFIDEIHRFNKTQQDALLGPVEQGLFSLLGATTENPSFALTPALLSRCPVLTLLPLSVDALEILLARAEHLEGTTLQLDSDARAMLLAWAEGDGRYFLGMCEQLFTQQRLGKLEGTWTVPLLEATLQRRAPLYDASGEVHYNLISALHKAVRGSDPDAALYWLQRMLQGGEDPRFLARRLIRMASEDIGLADPSALGLAVAAAQTWERLGTPEGDLALAQAAVYLATAPKSNAIYTAFKASAAFAQKYQNAIPPAHILNAPTAWMKTEGYGAGYQYDHDAPDAFSGQNYFPDGVAPPVFYTPTPRGFEREIQKRLDYWAALRQSRKQK